jgi:hypothetical protein
MTPVSQRPFRVGLVQMSCSTDPAENLEKAATKVREAAKAGAQTICLQELFRWHISAGKSTPTRSTRPSLSPVSPRQ